MYLKTFGLLFGMVLLGTNLSFGQTDLSDCKASLARDTLVIGNSKIERKWLWNQGNLIPLSLTNKSSGQTIKFPGGLPGFQVNARTFKETSDFQIIQVAASEDHAAHLAVSLVNDYDGLALRRVYRIYPHLPAISFEPSLKYAQLFPSAKEQVLVADGVEGKMKPGGEPEPAYLEHFALPGNHWLMQAITFVDQTDGHNNLVSEKEFIPYNASLGYTGNLLFAEDLVTRQSFFILKEAPNTTSQVQYPGFDFLISKKQIRIPFSGFPAVNQLPGWQNGYTITTGVADGPGEHLFALRSYLKGSIDYDPRRYEMIMMNTWGDRGKDGKISEKFILRELEGAAKLGITHFQIDDGWQQGLSMNSASTAGNLWDAWTAENWVPHPERFPNGLANIIASAKEKNIALGLWFHPTNENNYATWKRDADILIGLYRSTGIRYFKIDGVKLGNKVAEENLANFFKEVRAATQNQVFFNLDLTANVRGGYFMFRHTGNLFLENRYTDWGNYYPFHTLRNLWMLSKYFPPELIQNEFLNKWRNPEKYPPDDPFAPANYSFDYAFAVTMMGQSLAWMEASNLPEEAYQIAGSIRTYQTLMADIHAGTILPIGEMPNGRSWTGFQSLHGQHGYLLVFRENNQQTQAVLETYLPIGRKVKFEQLMGENKGVKIRARGQGKVELVMPQQNSYALFKYRLGR